MAILLGIVCDGIHDAVFVYAQLRIIEKSIINRAEQFSFSGFKTIALESTAPVVSKVSVNEIIYVFTGLVETGGCGRQRAVDPYLFRRGFRKEDVAGMCVGKQQIHKLPVYKRFLREGHGDVALVRRPAEGVRLGGGNQKIFDVSIGQI